MATSRRIKGPNLRQEETTEITWEEWKVVASPWVGGEGSETSTQENSAGREQVPVVLLLQLKFC